MLSSVGEFVGLRSWCESLPSQRHVCDTLKEEIVCKLSGSDGVDNVDRAIGNFHGDAWVGEVCDGQKAVLLLV